MKILMFGLSILLGALTGLLYDLQIPVLALGALKFTGPALAATLTVSLLLAISLIGISMILGRLDRLSIKTANGLAFNSNPTVERFGLFDGAKTNEPNATKAISATRRLPVIDLTNFELRAER